MSVNNIERKSFGATVSSEAEGIIEAIVSVFGNTDKANEVVMPGAFAASLARKLPKGVWAHNWSTPVSKTLEAREVAAGEHNAKSPGLYIKAAFNLDTQRGREAYSDIKFGIIDEFSIGYRVVKEQINNENDTRELIELELFEWSPVLVGMNPSTELLSIKGPAMLANPAYPVDPATEPATFAYQADYVQATISAFIARGKTLHAFRAKEGRVISTANRGRISACVEAIRGMQGLADDLEALLIISEPGPAKATEAEVRAVYAEYLRTVTSDIGR